MLGGLNNNNNNDITNINNNNNKQTKNINDDNNNNFHLEYTSAHPNDLSCEVSLQSDTQIETPR